MLRALDEYEIGGVTTLLGFHRALLSHPCFIEAATCHGIVESEELAEQAQQLSHRDNKRSAAARTAGSRARVTRRRARRAPLRRARAACPSRRTPSSPARRRERGAGRGLGGGAAATRSSARCRAPVLVGRGRRGRRGRGRPGGLHRRGDEDGERDRAPIATASSPSCRWQPGEPVDAGQVICVVGPASLAPDDRSDRRFCSETSSRRGSR